MKGHGQGRRHHHQHHHHEHRISQKKDLTRITFLSHSEIHQEILLKGIALINNRLRHSPLLLLLLFCWWWYKYTEEVFNCSCHNLQMFRPKINLPLLRYVTTKRDIELPVRRECSVATARLTLNWWCGTSKKELNLSSSQRIYRKSVNKERKSTGLHSVIKSSRTGGLGGPN